MKKKNGKESDKKLVNGYIKLILIFGVTVFLVILLRNWYLAGVNYQLNVSIINFEV